MTVLNQDLDFKAKRKDGDWRAVDGVGREGKAE